MASALVASGILTEDPDTGLATLTESQKAAIMTDSVDVIRNGTSGASPSASAYVLPGVTETLIPIEFQGNSDIADMIEADPEQFTPANETILDFSASVAEMLDFNIDSPVGLQVGFIDPTRIVAKIGAVIKETVPLIQDEIRSRLEEFREHLGDKIDDYADRIAFDLEGLKLSEILEKLASAAIILAAMIAKSLPMLDGVDELLILFGYPPIIGLLDDITRIIYEIIEFIKDLDLKSKIIDAIKEKLKAIISWVQDHIFSKIKEAILDFLLTLLALPDIPSLLPTLPEWVLNIPTLSLDIFNINLPSLSLDMFLQLPDGNILARILGVFQAIIDWITNIFTNPVALGEFILSILAALAKGVVGLIELLLEIILSIIQAIFGNPEEFITKAATLVVLIGRFVKWLAVSIVGIIFGEGEIFNAVANEIAG